MSKFFDRMVTPLTVGAARRLARPSRCPGVDSGSGVRVRLPVISGHAWPTALAMPRRILDARTVPHCRVMLSTAGQVRTLVLVRALTRPDTQAYLGRSNQPRQQIPVSGLPLTLRDFRKRP